MQAIAHRRCCLKVNDFTRWDFDHKISVHTKNSIVSHALSPAQTKPTQASDHSSVRSLLPWSAPAAALLLLPAVPAAAVVSVPAPAANSCSLALKRASTPAVKLACSSSSAGHSAMMRRAACSLGSFVLGLLHKSIVRACTTAKATTGCCKLPASTVRSIPMCMQRVGSVLAAPGLPCMSSFCTRRPVP